MSTKCDYCQKISEMVPSYVVKDSIIISENYQNRCQKHWQYVCSTCGKAHHFSGIAWDSTENVMLCAKCAVSVRISREIFWQNTYYFQMQSKNGVWLSALDYLEYQGLHPLDIGIDVKIASSPKLKQVSINHNKRQNISVPSEDDIANFWTQNSITWNADYTDEGDPQRRYLLPTDVILSHLGNVTKVLDAGCGGGYLCRQLAKLGKIVVGVDNSSGQIRIAKDISIKSDNLELMNIRYIETNLTNLEILYNDSLFDGAICTTVLENIQDYDKAILEISKILRPGGRLVITVIHPCFSMKDLVPVKIPVDGVRIEDIRHWEIDNYYARGVSLVKYSNLPAPTITFHRTLEDYSLALSSADFVMIKLLEPCPTQQQIDESPLLLKNRSNRIPRFLVIVAEKLDIKE